MMKGSYGQLYDVNWGALNFAYHAAPISNYYVYVCMHVVADVMTGR